MTPPAKWLLPPDSSSDAASSMVTSAPRSRAASAAQSAALPLPTTRTSQAFIISTMLSGAKRAGDLAGLDEALGAEHEVDDAVGGVALHPVGGELVEFLDDVGLRREAALAAARRLDRLLHTRPVFEEHLDADHVARA